MNVYVYWWLFRPLVKGLIPLEDGKPPQYTHVNIIQRLNQDRHSELFQSGQAQDVIVDVIVSALPLSVLYVL